MIIVEQALNAIVQALKFGENVGAACAHWWAVSDTRAT